MSIALTYWVRIVRISSSGCPGRRMAQTMGFSPILPHAELTKPITPGGRCWAGLYGLQHAPLSVQLRQVHSTTIHNTLRSCQLLQTTSPFIDNPDLLRGPAQPSETQNRTSFTRWHIQSTGELVQPGPCPGCSVCREQGELTTQSVLTMEFISHVAAEALAPSSGCYSVALSPVRSGGKVAESWRWLLIYHWPAISLLTVVTEHAARGDAADISRSSSRS